ncbi:MAG: DNRLRE domain-containing protein [Planctomycetota bacterium]
MKTYASALIGLAVTCATGLASAETLTFRQGVDGYAGTSDTSLFEDNANTSIAGSKRLFIQNGEKGGQPNQRHVLIRFGNLYGEGQRQVPAGATVTKATLTLSRDYGFSPDGGLEVYAMTVPFENGATWNSFGDGVSLGEQTESQPVGAFSLFNTESGGATADVTASVAAWASDPSANLGWAIREADRVGFKGTSAAYSSEAEDLDTRPMLTVEFTPAEPADPTEPE